MKSTKLLLGLLACSIFWSGGVHDALAAVARTPLQLDDQERILVLAPHPSDEILMTGGLIQEAREMELPVLVCFFTMGDNHEFASLFTRRWPAVVSKEFRVKSQGELRYAEARAATEALGLSPDEVIFLGYPDSGTMEIWNQHWRATPPLRSPLTRATAVPYDDALTPGSAHAGEDVLDDLMNVIRDFRPTMVILPHPADHQSDHRALALFAQVAMWNLKDEMPAPQWLSVPVHFTRWPEHLEAIAQQPAEPPLFLEADAVWLEYRLASFQITSKLDALQEHSTLLDSAEPLLNACIRKTELFIPLSAVSLPNGMGAAQWDESDNTNFRADPARMETLAEHSPEWESIIEEIETEATTLADAENDFIQTRLEGDGPTLTLAFRFRQPLEASSRLVIRVMPYQSRTPFGEQPKIEIQASSQKIVSIRDIEKSLMASDVELLPGQADEMKVRVATSVLGQPEKLFIGATLHKGKLRVDEIPWRVLDLTETPMPTTAPAVTPSKAVAVPAPAAPSFAPKVSQPTPPAQPNAPLKPSPSTSLPRKNVPEKSYANEPVMW